MRRVVLMALSVAVLFAIVPNAAPAALTGLATAHYGDYCATSGENTLNLSLEGPLRVGGQTFFGPLRTNYHVPFAGCGSTLPAFKMSLGSTLNATCTGVFHFRADFLSPSTGRLTCQATLVTPLGSAQGPLSIILKLRQYSRPPEVHCDLIGCEGEPQGRGYLMIGNYVRQ